VRSDTGVTSPWSPGEGRTPDGEAFHAALRAAADEHGLADATPSDAALLAWEGTVVVLVDLAR